MSRSIVSGTWLPEQAEKGEDVCFCHQRSSKLSRIYFFYRLLSTPTQDMDDEEDYSRCVLGTCREVDSFSLKKWSNFDSMKCGKGGLGESCRRSEVVKFQFAFEVVPSIAVLS